jgi:Predicted permease
MIERFLGNPTALLFLIIALGYALGAIRVRGVSLGASAVLFVALVFGHYGLTVPHEFADLGVILFVYSVGLQPGRTFSTLFRSRG